MPILGLLIIGAAAGFIATRLMRLETGLIPTVCIGMAGAVIGGLLLRLLLTVMGAMAGFVGAVLGALLLVWLWQRYLSR